MVGNVVAADAMMSGGDGQPETLAGVTVTLGGEHAMGETMQTAEDGGFAFTGLRAGTYTVTISDFPEDVSFETVSLEIEVDVGEVGSADFTGHFIRTSAVAGQVVIEGEGLAGITVTLSGGPADESYTMMTDADGMYRFEELRPGDYTVSISDFDTRDYEFAATSQDVSVDLDETGTVSFTGVLLRTSGIAGRVSVEGMGLGEITVTLAGADDRTAMTDAGGQYSFAGLAAGEYTVSIAVDSDAYVFESMSSDVTLADDQSAIVNFEGAHARTASVSGMAFIDELMKNDMYDEGEHPLAHAGLPVALVGPGVNEQRVSATDETGAFSFTGLRAGPYQLVVLIDGAVATELAANDLAYGGPGAGYEIALGVGEAATQAVPFDITHTTVNFAVTLRHGDMMGAPLSGASVSLYADAAGETKVGGGMTGDDGSVAIKVARAGTSGNMVHAGVAAEGYDVADGMTAVMWDPQLPATVGANSNDIVNLNVDVSVSGATVTTDYGGGDALGEWALSVTSGGAAVDGAPAALDTAGNASFMATVAKADLPVTYSFNVADDQADGMDGGESYEGSAAEYTHTGLALAGTADAGTIEVRYTTQTLVVFVHNERDQVFGFTGNIQGGDGTVNMNPGSSPVELEIEYQEGGRDHSFESDEWDADLNTQYQNDRTVQGPNGDTLIMGHRWPPHRVIFHHLPADKNVFVSARVKDGASYKILDKDPHNDVLDTFQSLDANGVIGGAFGAQGGFSSRVSLCPLQEKNPQNYDACSSFAIVNLYSVTGDVTMRDVKRERNGDDFEVDPADEPSFVEDFTAALVPKEGENFGGERVSFTTAEDDDDDTDLDERKDFMFEDVAAGAYSIADPSGWSASVTDADGERSSVDPIGSDVNIAFRPSTHTFYGHVTGADDFAVTDVTVTINGKSDVTDEAGRYIIKGINRVWYYNDDDARVRGYMLSTAREGQNAVMDTIQDTGAISPNDPYEYDIDLTSVGEYASVSGTVRASGSNAPVAGAKVEVNYGNGWVAPNNLNAKSDDDLAANDIYETGSDGTYSIEVKAQGLGGSVSVRVTKRGMSFVPGMISSIPAHAGSAVTGFDFTGFLHATVRGKVEAPGGGPLEGVAVTATLSGATDAAAEAETGRTGSFALSVPFGTYTVAATLTDYTFTYPTAHPNGVVNTAPGQTVDMGTIKAPGADFRVSGLGVSRDDDGTIRVTWSSNVADQDGVTAAFVVQVCTASTCAAANWQDTNVTAPDDPEGTRTSITTVGGNAVGGTLDGSFRVRVETTLTHTGLPSAGVEVHSSSASLGGLDPKATNVSAVRGVNASEQDTIGVTWDATTTTNTSQRVVIEVENSAGTKEWLVAGGTITAGTGDEAGSFSWTLNIDTDVTDGTTSWERADGSGSTAVTQAALLKGLRVRVEARHGTAGDWVAGGMDSVAAKPSG